MPRVTSPTHWRAWLRRWDRQQERFYPTREARFSVMFDVAEAALGRRFRALDLGSGPGSLSERLLRRFPGVHAVAVDYDPVVMQVGRGALGSLGGRLEWVDARLGSPGWTDRLPSGRFDAAFSTTALHWLTGPALRRTYRDLGRLLRPGGIFLNGDRLPWDANRTDLSRIAQRVRRVRFGPNEKSRWAGWEEWWADAKRLPALRAAFEEQARRHSEHPIGEDLPLSVHERALRSAGFRTVAVVWQDLENRVLLGRR